MALQVKTLIERARALANQKTQEQEQAYYTDAEIINLFLRPNWGKLYKELIAQKENYFVREDDFNITNDNENEFSINSFGEGYKFYKVKKVDYVYSEDYIISVPLVDIRRENELVNRNYGDENFFDDDLSEPKRGYYLKNADTLVMLPKTGIKGLYRLKWIPDTPPLQVEDESDPSILIDNPRINIPANFEEWIILSAAVEMRISQTEEVSDLKKERDDWWDKICNWANDRTNDEPKTIHCELDYDGHRTGSTALWRENN